MRRVDDDSTTGQIGNVFQLLDKDCPPRLQIVNDVLVVHHLVSHIDGSPKFLQRTLDDGDGAINARAKAARVGKDDGLRLKSDRCCVHGLILPCLASTRLHGHAPMRGRPLDQQAIVNQAWPLPCPGRAAKNADHNISTAPMLMALSATLKAG
ncbi:MAG: hypothetical protein BWZ07_03172 [Alphaproteobacteria bacterium ADurb.BinA280]|nr:MAG: hypothetical protein BWZ07_03172 [Alphaproteobacteria bacterium ADurb.BinA280]